MRRIHLMGILGGALAAAFLASARSVSPAQNISLGVSSLPPSPGHGRDHYRAVQARHDFSGNNRYTGPNPKGRSPRFNKYAHF